MRYQDIVPILRTYYDNTAAERDDAGVASWKVKERDVFFELLGEYYTQTLLELGSGPGRDGTFFP